MSQFVISSIELLYMFALFSLDAFYCCSVHIQQKSIIHLYRHAEGNLSITVIIFTTFTLIHGHLCWDGKEAIKYAGRKQCGGY